MVKTVLRQDAGNAGLVALVKDLEAALELQRGVAAAEAAAAPPAAAAAAAPAAAAAFAVGGICMAPWVLPDGDGRVYLSKVLSVEGATAQVQFVEYGNAAAAPLCAMFAASAEEQAHGAAVVARAAAAAHKAAAPAQRKPASSPASAVTKSVSPAAASAAAATAPAEAPADKAAAVAKPALTEKEKEAKRKTDRAAKKKLRSATFEAETNAKQSSWQKFSSKKRRGISKVRNDGPR